MSTYTWAFRVLRLLSAGVLAGCSGSAGSVVAAAPAPTTIPSGAQSARVTSVVDGDTLRVLVIEPGALPVGSHKIRLLQIDAPELGGNGGRGECGAQAALDYLAGRLPVGRAVFLAADVEGTDRYGRPLRYMWDAEGSFINEQIVRNGHARAVLYPPNDRYIDLMRQLEQEAQQAGAGLWGNCAND